MKSSVIAIPLLAGALAMGGCGPTAPAASSAGTVGVFDRIRAHNATAGKVGGVYSGPPEAMPQVRYIVDGKGPLSVADAYVVGDLVTAEPGRSFRWSDDAGKEVRHELPFNSKEAQVSTVHLTIQIQRSIVDPDREETQKSLEPGDSITLGLALGAPVDVDAIRTELKKSDSLAALLYRPSPVFDYDPSLWAIGEDGAFLGTVLENRTVTFPALEAINGFNGEDADNRPSYPVSELEKPSDKVITVTRDPETGGYRRGDPPAGGEPS